jgi:hypothetical protein
MQIHYSKHLTAKLALRNIDYGLPEEIFENAEENYFDTVTGYDIAVKKVTIYSKVRDVMVAYIQENNYVHLLTIHPLKKGQKENRIKSGRWRII